VVEHPASARQAAPKARANSRDKLLVTTKLTEFGSFINNFPFPCILDREVIYSRNLPKHWEGVSHLEVESWIHIWSLEVGIAKTVKRSNLSTPIPLLPRVPDGKWAVKSNCVCGSSFTKEPAMPLRWNSGEWTATLCRELSIPTLRRERQTNQT
jgi:hypothetical protein